jgi:hypothetical protein
MTTNKHCSCIITDNEFILFTFSSYTDDDDDNKKYDTIFKHCSDIISIYNSIILLDIILYMYVR